MFFITSGTVNEEFILVFASALPRFGILALLTDEMPACEQAWELVRFIEVLIAALTLVFHFELLVDG